MVRSPHQLVHALLKYLLCSLRSLHFFHPSEEFVTNLSTKCCRTFFCAPYIESVIPIVKNVLLHTASLTFASCGRYSVVGFKKFFDNHRSVADYAYVLVNFWI